MDSRYFTRNRILTFPIMLRKSLKSIQLTLNELSLFHGLPTLTNSAYTQARKKLNYTAFIALNRDALIPSYYEEEAYQKVWGFRLLAVDGSIIILPKTKEVAAYFGKTNHIGKNQEIIGYDIYARASVLYDVCNRIVLDGALDKYETSEQSQAEAHLASTSTDDLLLFDRGYPSYSLMAQVVSQPDRHFVMRCSNGSFITAKQLFLGTGKDSRIVTLRPSTKQKEKVKRLGLPSSLRVRFVRVLLNTGEIEVLDPHPC